MSQGLLLTTATLVLVILYQPLIYAGWRFDDGHHLLYASHYSPWEYFLIPDIARLQSGAHFTPFNVIVYELCLNFSSGRPGVGYAFHLLLILLMAGLIWRYLTALYDTCAGWVSCLFYATGFPVVGMSNQLMVGHYLIGGVFFAFFLLRYETRTRHKSQLDVLLCVTYFLACLSKEVFIVAPVLLLLDRRHTLPLKHIASLGTTFVIFWIIRTLILQRVVGGYSDHFPFDHLYNSVHTLFSGFVSRALEFPLPGYPLVIIISIILMIAFVRMGHLHGWVRAIGTTVILCFVCFAPLLPVANNLMPGNDSEIRLLFFPFMLLSIVVGSIVNRSAANVLAFNLAMACLIASAVYSIRYEYHSGLIKESRRFDSFSTYAITLPDCYLIDSNGWSSWVAELAQARGMPLGHRLVAPEPVLHALGVPGTPLCGFVDGKLYTSGIADPTKVHIDQSTPMALSIVYSGTHATVQWQSVLQGSLAFYKPGHFMLYISPGLTYPLPDPMRFNNFHPILIGNDGTTIAIGPKLDFQPLKPGTWHWERLSQ